jgi:hypothetical protein
MVVNVDIFQIEFATKLFTIVIDISADKYKYEKANPLSDSKAPYRGTVGSLKIWC